MAKPKQLAAVAASETYGAPVDPSWSQQRVEWWCFSNNWKLGPGRAEHFKRAFKLTWPRVMWEARHPETGETIPNHWMQRIVEVALGDEYVVRNGNTTSRYLVLSGVGAAGKTFTSACLAMGWWAASPGNSLVVLTSTTKEMIGKRIWPTIANLHGSALLNGRPAPPTTMGDIIDSRRLICSVSNGIRDEKMSITALAVAHGETQKAAHNLRGLHADRILVIVDEANGTPEAIFETIPNWSRACNDLTVILIGNPISRLDPHGRAMEPSDPTTSPTATEWRTKRIPEWDFGPGVALRFDGRDSPNVRAGLTLFPYIYTCEDRSKAVALNENTLASWSQHSGLHPPEGILSSVLNETALENAKVDETLAFMSDVQRVSFLDPAFGGDAAVQWIGVVGTLPDGRRAIQLKERLEIEIEFSTPEKKADEPDLQLAKAFKRNCEERRVAPEHAGIDATGTGRGVYAFVATFWSPEVFRFEASESPSDQPVMEGDPRPASETLFNQMTESWVLAASFVRSGQLKGLNRAAKVEFTTRVFHDKTVRGRKRLEDKQDFVSRYGHSPDDADSIAGLAVLARKRMGVTIALPAGTTSSAANPWTKFSADWSRVYQERESAAPIPEPEDPLDPSPYRDKLLRMEAKSLTSIAVESPSDLAEG